MLHGFYVAWISRGESNFLTQYFKLVPNANKFQKKYAEAYFLFLEITNLLRFG